MVIDIQDTFPLFVKIPDNNQPILPYFYINSTPSGSIFQLIDVILYMLRRIT